MKYVMVMVLFFAGCTGERDCDIEMLKFYSEYDILGLDSPIQIEKTYILMNKGENEIVRAVHCAYGNQMVDLRIIPIDKIKTEDSQVKAEAE